MKIINYSNQTFIVKECKNMWKHVENLHFFAKKKHDSILGMDSISINLFVLNVQYSFKKGEDFLPLS